MNFFEQQDQARQNTTRLLGLFGVAIATMIALLYSVILVGLLFLESKQSLAGQAFGVSLWQPELLWLCSLSVLAVVGLGSLWKLQTLRQGGHAVAVSLGGRRIAPDTQAYPEQLLLNVVEEMALAAGVSVPAVYLLEQEAGINAFAAGYSPNDAVIGVTRGCVEQLSRDELQGVIGHEFSHILNGDMSLNLRLIGVLHGILLIYLIGRVTLESAGRGGKDKGWALVMGLALIVIGGTGFLCGRLIKSAVSRQREFLADAAAVQFTRNPDGLRHALLKLAGHRSHLQSPRAEEASHLFFGNAFSRAFFDPFATHPPLEERVRRLSRSVQPLASAAAVIRVTGAQRRSELVTAAVPGVALAGFTAEPAQNPSFQVAPERVVASIGTTDPQHLAFARGLLAKLPTPLREAIKQPAGAMAIVYGLLLDADPAARTRQMALLKESVASDVLEILQQFRPVLPYLSPRTRLPLVDLAIPALRTMSKPACAQFFEQVKALVKADGRLSLSEYVLQLVLQQRLRPYFQSVKPNTASYTSLDPIWPDCITLLLALAQVGHKTPDTVFFALRSGLSRLPGVSKRTLPAELTRCGLHDVSRSLKRLALAAPKLKQAIVDACAHTVLMDHQVTLAEADLLRAIVISLDCPLPPFLEIGQE
jgi:Zn-dependent protease with chaperone function